MTLQQRSRYGRRFGEREGGRQQTQGSVFSSRTGQPARRTLFPMMQFGRRLSSRRRGGGGSSKDGGRAIALSSGLRRSVSCWLREGRTLLSAAPNPAMSEPGHLGVKRAESAKLRRAEQLKRWKGSLTELEPVTAARSRHRGGGRVRFEDGAVFLAACASGDTDEVRRLLARGARLNTANVDGLTALHQVR